MKLRGHILPTSFGIKSQTYLKFFLLFTAWPVLSIGLSVTLYFFIFLLLCIKYRAGTYFLKVGPKSLLFYAFAFISFISMVFAPWDMLPLKLLDDIQIQIQYVYWMLVAVFFMNVYGFMDKSQFNKVIFIGLGLHTLHFFFFSTHLSIPFVRPYVSRNGFIFTVLALWPLASGYVYNKYGKKGGNRSLVIVFFIVLLTDGRAGVVIVLIENIFIYFVNNKTSAKLIRGILTVIVPLVLIFGSDIASDENRNAVGDLAAKLSPRVGLFIKGAGDAGDLSFDKSWLTRKLMISKGKEIITDYPFFGVGIGHFTDYRAELYDFDDSEYQRLGGDVKFDRNYYNRKSSHNSYLQVLGETGIVGFISLSILLIPPLFFSFWKLYTLTITKEDLILISFIGICIHFYVITSLPGTLTWFIIGLTYSRIYKSDFRSKGIEQRTKPDGKVAIPQVQS